LRFTKSEASVPARASLKDINGAGDGSPVLDQDSVLISKGKGVACNPRAIERWETPTHPASGKASH